MNKFKINKFDLDSDCLNCPLSNQPLVNIETNCENLSDVDLLIIAEAPSINEIKYDQPLHPNGDSGRGFRMAFDVSGLSKLNYCISNACLCSNIINNKTVKPPKEALQFCAVNLDNLISNCNPKCILALGKTIQYRLKISGSKITQLRGHFYKYLEYDIFLTIHPRYLQMQGGIHSNEGKLFLNDLALVWHHIESKKLEI